MSTSFRKSGPVLDEATFQKLLAAAYVLQEHHDRTREITLVETNTENPDADSDTSILAQIVETQHEIQTSHLDLASTANLVVQRILKITGAQGAALGILEDDHLVYHAGRGILARQVGQSMRPEATLSSSTLHHGVILRCTDAGTDFRVNPEVTKRLGIGSLISVPIFHDSRVDGSLELVFAKKDAFHDQDVRTCQLMAGLVTETLTRTTEEDWRKGLAAERASMLEVLEKIKPQLARLASAPDTALGKAQPEAADNLEKATCQHCGSELAPQETFCVSCGTFRSDSSHSDLQSKWATLWNLKNASQPQGSTSSGDSVLKDPAVWQGLPTQEFSASEKQEAAASPSAGAFNSETESSANASIPPGVPEAGIPEESIRPAGPPAPGPVKAEPRVWFRSIAVSPPAVQLHGFLKKSSGFARQHRGDLALAASFVLFLITIVWAVSSDHPTTSADS
jgi:GAF domain-containing protein